MKEINLEELLKKYYISYIDDKTLIILRAMKEACRQTLELAAENAYAVGKGSNLTTMNGSLKWTFAGNIGDVEINKQSILDTINQIK